MNENVLSHHGILKQKWGIRNGPPYPLKGGAYSPSEKKAIRNKRKSGNSVYNKKHFDEVLKADKTTLNTLSYDKDRTKNTDMFYASHKTFDNHQYNLMFNRKIPQTIYDDNGNPIGTGTFTKWKIKNSIKTDMKVASEDSGAEIFRELYKNDRDFYNFVTDKERMQAYFTSSNYRHGSKAYKESVDVLNRMKESADIPTGDDLQTVYRLFNYIIPYDGQGDSRKAHDVYVQRTKFFKACKDAGYGAVLDTNDALYGAFKGTSPIIVFDMEQVIPKEIYRTKASSRTISALVFTGRKMIFN